MVPRILKSWRWIVAGVLSATVLAGYAATYRFLPWRDAGRARRAGVFVHCRQFRHDWQVYFFAPAALVESWIIRADPTPFLPHPSWAALPQVLVLEGDQAKVIYPRDAFARLNQP